MNMETNPTVDELRALIRAEDDRAGHHIVWVATNGDVHVSIVPEDMSPVDLERIHPDMQLRLETFQIGNEYVGPTAAEDNDWMNQLFEALNREWPRARGTGRIECVDTF